jgi:hypothetical protein
VRFRDNGKYFVVYGNDGKVVIITTSKKTALRYYKEPK